MSDFDKVGIDEVLAANRALDSWQNPIKEPK
jgi:hypothetical protein